MRYLLFFLLLIAFAQPGFASDCDFDQKTRIAENIKLKNKYPGGYLADGNLVLVVPVDEGEVRINIGGCVHYGVTIDLKTKAADTYKNEKDFMNKILYLAKTYSQGMVEYAKLKKIIETEDWTQTSGRYYFFNYDGMPFEVYEIKEGPYTIIGFSYYR